MPRVRHYWHHALRRERPERFAAAVCDAAKTVGMLSETPQKALSWFGRAIAFLTTPFKFLGISGWKETGCQAQASGAGVRDSQHSTDGFWTIDVALSSFAIRGNAAGSTPPKFVRIEVEPHTRAHDVCAAQRIAAGTALSFGGPVVIDTDGPFLEVHPDSDFRISV
ncbi:MAG TPA: hypothetical protein VJA66_08705 [Thermoanaerobaculia bacterium]